MSYPPKICAMLVLTVQYYSLKQTKPTLRKLHPVQIIRSVGVHVALSRLQLFLQISNRELKHWELIYLFTPLHPQAQFIKQLGSPRAPYSLKTRYVAIVGWLWGLLRPEVCLTLVLS